MKKGVKGFIGSLKNQIKTIYIHSIVIFLDDCRGFMKGATILYKDKNIRDIVYLILFCVFWLIAGTFANNIVITSVNIGIIFLVLLVLLQDLFLFRFLHLLGKEKSIKWKSLYYDLFDENKEQQEGYRYENKIYKCIVFLFRRLFFNTISVSKNAILHFFKITIGKTLPNKNFDSYLYKIISYMEGFFYFILKCFKGCFKLIKGSYIFNIFIFATLCSLLIVTGNMGNFMYILFFLASIYMILSFGLDAFKKKNIKYKEYFSRNIYKCLSTIFIVFLLVGSIGFFSFLYNTTGILFIIGIILKKFYIHKLGSGVKKSLRLGLFLIKLLLKTLLKIIIKLILLFFGFIFVFINIGLLFFLYNFFYIFGLITAILLFLFYLRIIFTDIKNIFYVIHFTIKSFFVIILFIFLNIILLVSGFHFLYYLELFLILLIAGNILFNMCIKFFLLKIRDLNERSSLLLIEINKGNYRTEIFDKTFMDSSVQRNKGTYLLYVKKRLENTRFFRVFLFVIFLFGIWIANTDHYDILDFIMKQTFF